MKLIITILILISTSVWAEPISVRLRRTTVEDVVRRLRNDGFVVHFERCLNQPEDALSLKKQIEILDAIPTDERTPAEQRLYILCLKQRKTGEISEDCIVNWRLSQFDFDYPEEIADVSTVLDAIVRGNPEYLWKKVSHSYVVYPVEKTFNRKIEMVLLRDADRDQAFEVISRTVLMPCGLNLGWTHIGPGPTLWKTLENKRFSLTCKGEDTHAILTQFAEILDPRIVWSVLGSKANRNLGFSNIPRKEE